MNILHGLISKMNFNTVCVIEERPLYYPISPATLQEFAATKLAIDLWQYHYHFKETLRSRNPTIHTDSQMLFNAVLSSSIAELIDQHIDSVGKSIFHLVEDFIIIGIFPTHVKNNIISKLDNVVYGPDATVSVEATAKQLLNSDKLTLMEKYKIIRIFCFETDARKIWPWVCDQPNANYSFLSERRLVRRRNDSENPLADINCIIWDMWTTFGYFLYKIFAFNRRLEYIEELLILYDFSCAEYLLPKLNQAQVDFVLEKYPHRIIAHLASLKKYIDYMMKIWTRVKDSITDDHFSYIMITCGKLCDKTSPVQKAFSEIWISASPRLRSNFVNNHAAKLFNGLRLGKIYETEFFSLLLAEMSAELRDEIWRKYWLLVLVNSRPKNIHNFLNLCKLCLKKKYIEKFIEKELMNYDKLSPWIESRLKEGYYDDVIDYINVVLADRPDVRKFRKQILESNSLLPLLFHRFKSENEFLDLRWFEELAEFIDRFSENAEDAEIIKNKVFSSHICVDVLMSMLEEGWVMDVIRSSELFSLSEENLLLLKRKLYEPFEWLCICDASKGVFRLSAFEWIAFSYWADPEQIHAAKFMKSIPVDKVFKNRLHHAIEKRTAWLGPLELQRSEPVPYFVHDLEDFSEVDEFLEWYFGSEIAARNYKWDVILNCPEKGDLGKIFDAKNECIVNDVLCWFFNNDLIEIGYFMEKLKKN